MIKVTALKPLTVFKHQMVLDTEVISLKKAYKAYLPRRVLNAVFTCYQTTMKAGAPEDEQS
jgi:hypothetical protein